ncbi:MAG: FAD-binding oxidoreductase [Luminiphilus sp.]|nr:FAD-binding oxidoreductase [Luminiphilus sp.]
MTTRIQHTESWYAASASPHRRFPALSGEVETDVCVVGGGYTGLSTALHLRKLGFSVTLLEARRIGWGASGRNGGHVGTGQRADQENLEKWVGPGAAKDLWRLGLNAVDLVCNLIKEFHIKCELREGNLHLAAKKRHVQGLRDEVDHLSSVYGYDQMRFVDSTEMGWMTRASGMHGALLDRGARHLHPLKYAYGLAKAADLLGAEIHEGSEVLGYEDNSGAQVKVRTATGTVKARFLVLACNGYLGNLEPRIAGNIMPINNFMLATEPLSAEQQNAVTRDNFSLSDTLYVINYWKLSADGRLLFGGGENYSSRFPKDIPAFVWPHMLKIYPELSDVAIEYGWGGTLGITMNRMPDFGQLGRRTFYAQGFSGHGVPTATMAGYLLAAAISGDTDDFSRMAAVPTHRFPGGTLLRKPGQVAGMLFYSLLDRLGR